MISFSLRVTYLSLKRIKEYSGPYATDAGEYYRKYSALPSVSKNKQKIPSVTILACDSIKPAVT